jgi:hypothetical protein
MKITLGNVLLFFNFLYSRIALFIWLSQWDVTSKGIVSMDGGKMQQPEYP